MHGSGKQTKVLANHWQLNGFQFLFLVHFVEKHDTTTLCKFTIWGLHLGGWNQLHASLDLCRTCSRGDWKKTSAKISHCAQILNPPISNSIIQSNPWAKHTNSCTLILIQQLGKTPAWIVSLFFEKCRGFHHKISLSRNHWNSPRCGSNYKVWCGASPAARTIQWFWQASCPNSKHNASRNGFFKWLHQKHDAVPSLVFCFSFPNVAKHTEARNHSWVFGQVWTPPQNSTNNQPSGRWSDSNRTGSRRRKARQDGRQDLRQEKHETREADTATQPRWTHLRQAWMSLT